MRATERSTKEQINISWWKTESFLNMLSLALMQFNPALYSHSTILLMPNLNRSRTWLSTAAPISKSNCSCHTCCGAEQHGWKKQRLCFQSQDHFSLMWSESCVPETRLCRRRERYDQQTALGLYWQRQKGWAGERWREWGYGDREIKKG